MMAKEDEAVANEVETQEQADADNVEEEKGHQGQAKKDMEAVTGYVDESMGGAVDQNKLDKALNLVQAAKVKAAKTARELEMDKVVVQKPDLELIMKEFEITKAQADKALRVNNGDLAATMRHLVGI
ncbi:hypothetical protein BC831DRAFT_474897 [Entophlyctis helioformis]|nr:hypothetical protein BC831DRAFT_474897 [Entophlyctis helioformis]